MKENTSIFRAYPNTEKVYVSQTSLGLVDGRLIGVFRVFLQADPNITFRDDLKQAIMEVMADGTPISIFLKRVKEPSKDLSRICVTNGLAVQVAKPDSKKAAEYIKTFTKTMEYFNGNDSHPILSSKVFLLFGKSAAIYNGNFRKLIHKKNEYLHKICHIEVHHLCNIDK
jgi:hypothetical protein